MKSIRTTLFFLLILTSHSFKVIAMIIFKSSIYFLVYSILTFYFLFSSSLWTLYFGLELQWMLLTIFFIIGSSVCRGLFNYLILNGILSISLILGILFSNSLFFILACFGKIGYFPFFLVLACLWYCSSYLFLMIDRKVLLKFFLCYELFFFILSVIILMSSLILFYTFFLFPLFPG